MPERLYKCGYKHCLFSGEKVPLSKSVAVGKRRYHKECAELHRKVDEIKRIYFDLIDDKSDYVQVLGVINNLIFKQQYDVDFVAFTMKYVVAYCSSDVKSPYILHLIIKNKAVKEKYDDPGKREDVIWRFENRCRKGTGS